MTVQVHARGSKGPKRISGSGSKNFNGVPSTDTSKYPIKFMGDSEERKNSTSKKTNMPISGKFRK